MENTARQLGAQLQAKVVGHVELSPEIGDNRRQSTLPEPLSAPASPATEKDAFLSGSAGQSWQADHLKRELSRVLAEINELQAAARWQDIVALFFPVEDKLPELVDAGMDSEVRLKLSFALCRADRHEQAISCLLPVVAREKENSLANYNIGYCVLDYFFRARTERRLIPGQRRGELIKLAHHHFDIARRLRPASVTFCYRQAILYKDIEDKPKQAVPLFQQAIANWHGLSPEDQQKYHQQRPKYSKSMYHLASCLLKLDRAGESLGLLKKLLVEDQQRNHLKPLFKHFAMGKVLHALGRYEQSLQQLETAAYVAERGQATDFVHELSARNWLCLKKPEKAMEAVGRIAPQARRPYVVWTEAEALAGLGRHREAVRLLQRSADKDRRSKHIALIRICRLALQLEELPQALDVSRKAVRFCVDTYGNPSREAQFWEAVCLYRLGRCREALPLVEELENGRFQYPNFSRLAALVRAPRPVPPARPSDNGPATAGSLKKIK
jgi:tetratricopeptide (TPR) repeat protein